MVLIKVFTQVVMQAIGVLIFAKKNQEKDSPYPFYVQIIKKDISIKRMHKDMCMRIRLVKD